MKITNRFGERVFWRLFDTSDDWYVLGFEEGFLDNNGEAKPSNLNGRTEVRIEIKKKGAVDFSLNNWLVTPTLIHTNKDIVITSDKTVIEV